MANIIGKVAWRIVQMIEQGIAAPGETLPSEAELERLTGFSRHYIYYALKQLQQAELIRRRQRGGSVVLRKPTPREIKNFRNRSSDRICLLNHLSPELYDYAHLYYNSRLLEPLNSGLKASGWNLQCCDFGTIPNPEEYLRKLEKICEGGVFALIVISASYDFHLFTKLLSEFHDNLFIFNRSEKFEDDFNFNQIAFNHYNSGRLAAEAAVRAGAKQFFFCGQLFSQSPPWQEQRREGVAAGIWRAFSGRVLLNSFILGLHGNFPLKVSSPDTALIASNDEAAAICIQAGRAIGLEPGRDYKIMGFEDDIRFRDLELTTMSPDLELVAELLVEGINRSAVPDYSGLRFTFLVTSKLIRRKTL